MTKAQRTKLGLKNNFMTPKLTKVVLNMGLGVDGNDAKIVSSCKEDLGNLTGQLPVNTKFRKSQ